MFTTNHYWRQSKAIWTTPIPSPTTWDFISVGSQVVALFSVIFFIFKLADPPDNIFHTVLEWIALGISLFGSFLVLGGIHWLYLQFTKKTMFPTLGSSLLAFLIIYNLMMLFIHLIEMGTGDLEWEWDYYWQNYPFALMIFGIFQYREYQKIVVDDLVSQLNTKLAEISEKQNQQPHLEKDEPPPLEVPVNGISVLLLPKNITHISVHDHYLEIYHLTKGKIEMISLRKPLEKILEELPQSSFQRIHRSHIVNLEFVAKLKKEKRNYCVILYDQQFSLPISRSYLSQVLSRLENQV